MTPLAEVVIIVSQDDVLLAYQVAFDLVENEMQSFLQQVSTYLLGLSSSVLCLCMS